ncbi:rhomboid family intramembrane serine protease [Virgibacillus sp. 179-BFC.A HS]|uniref:Rhomboid family intramembrane serine protease n=1 Tax=Tigheibacillus jepli TaxID=3035914 RepID=A0ABU5CEU2_9BACI|nr:rhomboid family intramembrane serine protease [Virgibacillus sp. 179-BFC.A HS]MDY0404856.1 rhomboid family intramembrane serine protease [Virgibacillus sp. 179-BFC.A HS]
MGGGKGFNNMDYDEWYRLLTSLLFHQNILHLLGNTFGIYFVGIILENKIDRWQFFILYLMGNLGASIVFSIFTNYIAGTGASPGIYALIACIIILRLRDKEFLDLHYGNWPVNYTLFYFILGNFYGASAFVVHILGFSFGAIITLIFIYLKLFLHQNETNDSVVQDRGALK